MAIDTGRWDLTDEDFGPLLEYVKDDNVTDILLNCDGAELWIKDLKKGKYRVENHGCDKAFVKGFTARVSNSVSKQFNKMEPLLEAETDNLRISCLFDSAAVSGVSVCIRKSLPFIRIDAKEALEQKYFSKPIMNLLINCVLAKMNFVFCGEPGVGKTECAKFFSQFISETDRVITIEDTPEFHYRKINPGKDCVEMKVDDKVFDYSKAIKACLRQEPQWIMLSEARSREVKYLLECMSTGVCGFTTIHTDDVRKIPDRIKNMLGDKTDAARLENDIFSFVDVGVLVRLKKKQDGSVYRYIDQVCFFVREGEKNRTVMVVEDGKMISIDSGEKTSAGKKKYMYQPLPADIMKKLLFADIESPVETPSIPGLNALK